MIIIIILCQRNSLAKYKLYVNNGALDYSVVSRN